jgi:trans-L-3-hydroxyproline dehydratase
MYGVLPVEPDLPGADMAVLFMHNEGYSTMCGHATIALGRYALERRIVVPKNGRARLNLQCPCGLVEVETQIEADGRAGETSFLSVPAFAFALDLDIAIPGKGRVQIDIGYGGAFYAFLPAGAFGLDVRRSPVRDLVEAAHGVTTAVKSAVALNHPESPDLAFLYGTILTDGRSGLDAEAPSANICVFADREVDRSPTGSGATARVALLAARGQMAPGQVAAFESITGSIFKARLAELVPAGRFSAIRALVSGRSHYCGRSIFTLEPDDPLLPGFLVN